VNEPIPPRRTVLRAALGAGCSLWMPITLAATQKTPPASVHYQPKPKGDQKCSACLNFIIGSNACKVVEGQISAEGWCSLWGNKA
jgi:hypothetical protein